MQSSPERRDMSRALSERSRQPGHDQDFLEAEQNFYNVLNKLLDSNIFQVDNHPKDLKKMFHGKLGLEPDAKVTHIPSQKVIYFEVKRQGASGNAEERAFKNHTVQFQKVIREKLGLPYHPFVTVFCKNLAEDERYLLKIPYFIEPDHYLLWKKYDVGLLYDYLGKIFNDWFSEPLPPECPDVSLSD